jgi:hypothetical protein
MKNVALRLASKTEASAPTRPQLCAGADVPIDQECPVKARHLTAVVVPREIAIDSAPAGVVDHSPKYLGPRPRGTNAIRPAMTREAAHPTTARLEQEIDSASQAMFCLDRRYCSIWFRGEECFLPYLKGLHYIAMLLQIPGRKFPARELVTMLEAPMPPSNRARLTPNQMREWFQIEGGGIGPLLDTKAKRDYRRRLAFLREQYSDALANNDAGASDLAREIELIEQELAGALGLGGMDRPVRSADERARVLVTKNIRSTALKRIADLHRPLARHLHAQVKTGRCCSYQQDPDQRVEWRVETPSGHRRG